VESVNNSPKVQRSTIAFLTGNSSIGRLEMIGIFPFGFWCTLKIKDKSKGIKVK